MAGATATQSRRGKHTYPVRVDFKEVLAKRRMIRAFRREPLPTELVDELLEAATRAPSAGNTQGCHFVVLQGGETSRAWGHITTPEWRANSARRTLLDAPVVIIPCFSPTPYCQRYAEEDKAASGLSDPNAWPIEFWQVDAAFATMTLLLKATDAGLGAALVGIFRGESALMEELGAPSGMRPLGLVALGWPAPSHPSASLGRKRIPLADRVHRGGWAAKGKDQDPKIAGSVSDTSPGTTKEASAS